LRVRPKRGSSSKSGGAVAEEAAKTSRAASTEGLEAAETLGAETYGKEITGQDASCSCLCNEEMSDGRAAGSPQVRRW
jgi:hypothetical protein